MQLFKLHVLETVFFCIFSLWCQKNVKTAFNDANWFSSLELILNNFKKGTCRIFFNQSWKWFKWL